MTDTTTQAAARPDCCYGGSPSAACDKCRSASQPAGTEREQFAAWFNREYPLDANGYTRSKYQDAGVMDLMLSAYQAGRASDEWMALAHTICAEAGIEPGNIGERLAKLREMLQSEVKCKTCGDGEYYPIYGVGPHRHAGDSMIGSTVHLPKEEWPANYSEDPDCPGLGTWTCPDCGEGSVAGSQQAAKEGGGCMDCGGTGLRDSGGFHPWGEPVMIPCDCAAKVDK